jgi:hypothetical protein
MNPIERLRQHINDLDDHGAGGVERLSFDDLTAILATIEQLYRALDEAADFIQPFNGAAAVLERVEAALAQARGEQ